MTLIEYTISVAAQTLLEETVNSAIVTEPAVDATYNWSKVADITFITGVSVWWLVQRLLTTKVKFIV